MSTHTQFMCLACKYYFRMSIDRAQISRSPFLVFALAAFLPSIALSAPPAMWSSNECVGMNTRCVPGSSSEDMVFDNGLESAGDLPTGSGNWLYSLSTAGDGIRERSTTHSREGSYSVRQRVTKDGTNNYRTELRVQSATDDIAQAGSSDYWLGISTYIPSTSSSTDSVVLQWHKVNADIPGDSSPVIGISLSGGDWKMTREVGSWSGANLGVAVTNQWTDWVFHIRWRADATGLIEIWKNGLLVVGSGTWRNIQTGSSEDWEMPFFKFGRYSWPWKNPSADPDGAIHESYHDSVRICYGATCRYSDVAPRGDRLAAH